MGFHLMCFQPFFLVEYVYLCVWRVYTFAKFWKSLDTFARPWNLIKKVLAQRQPCTCLLGNPWSGNFQGNPILPFGPRIGLLLQNNWNGYRDTMSSLLEILGSWACAALFATFCFLKSCMATRWMAIHIGGGWPKISLIDHVSTPFWGRLATRPPVF